MIYIVHKLRVAHNNQQHLSIKFRSYKTFDEQAFQADLSTVDWSCVYNCDSADEAWNNLQSILLKYTDNNAPLKERHIKVHDLPWMNDDVLDAIRLRDNLLRKFHLIKIDTDFNNFKKKHNYVVNLI